MYSQSSGSCASPLIKITLEKLNCDGEECSQIFNVDILSYKFKIPSPLEACVGYRYSIAETGDDVNNDPVEMELTANENFEEVELISLISNATTLSVYWATPKRFLFCPKMYRVKVFLDGETGVTNNLEKAYVDHFHGLQPCEIYKIVVTPISRAEIEMSEFAASDEKAMKFFYPSPVRDLKLQYNSGEKAIAIAWNEPNTARKCVSSYQVNLVSDVDNRIKTTDYTNENFPNVFACEPYTVEVIIVPTLGLPEPGEKKEILIPSRGKSF